MQLPNNAFSNVTPGLVILLVITSAWTLFWRGFALWRSAQNKQMVWFIALFFLSYVNLLGIPELIYLFKFSKKRLTIDEIKSWFKRK